MQACEIMPDESLPAPVFTNGLSQRAFKGFQQLIFASAGINMADGKKTLVATRLNKRLRALNLPDLDSYYHYLTEGDGTSNGEHQLFIDLLTTNETYFFREPEHFTFLRDVVLSISSKDRPFRIWSAASSSGEEAYTLAMIMANEWGLDDPWEILGTDISEDVIRMARQAIYNEHRTRMLPVEMRHRYLLKGKGQRFGLFAVVPELKKHVTFEHYNLLDGSSRRASFDVIFCRNVLIYFNRETKKKVIERLGRQLKPGGYLFTGLSESLHGIHENLKSIKPSVYQQPDAKL